MATILDQRHTGDGYDVRILTAGEAHVLHFSSQPNEAALADAIAAFETCQMDVAINEQEEGTYVIFDQ